MKRIVIFVFGRLFIFIVYINTHNAIESFMHFWDKAHFAMAFYSLNCLVELVIFMFCLLISNLYSHLRGSL